MIKEVTHAHLGPIWYHSEPSDVHYFPNQFLDRDFFATSYSKAALDFASKTVFRNGLIGQKPIKRMHWVIKN